ncbi:MAG TPA: hypothetical protein VGO09_06005 [Flavisolibacter sp.]|nr:hypothetical protein [Flavisolibacter sp.]
MKTNFTKIIEVENDILNFDFNLINHVHGMKYFITTFDRNQILYSFSMEYRKGNWKIITETAPGWIFSIEEILSKAIVE